jgi:hypothetical protein
MAYKRISPQPVVEGGTGVQSNTVYAVLCGGTTSAGAIQSIASVGTAGQILTSNGAGALPTFANPAGTSTLTYTLVNTSPYVVLSTDEFLGVDCSGGAIQVNLPNAPATGRTYVIKDITGNAQTNNITVTTVGGVVLVDSAATYVMNTQYSSINVLFNGTKYLVF